MVRVAGIEPARLLGREILSLLCLPISPHSLCMACPEGLEPPTYSLEGCCSIQLSYGQIFWSGRRGSNSRHLPWQGNALPTELLPHYSYSKSAASTNRYA